MDGRLLFWIVVFSVSALLFFGTALAITIYGIRDLKDLLTHHVTKKPPE